VCSSRPIDFGYNLYIVTCSTVTVRCNYFETYIDNINHTVRRARGARQSLQEKCIICIIEVFIMCNVGTAATSITLYGT